jgi:hypothetical protein
MKRLIAAVLLISSVSAQADGYHHHSGSWIAPVIIGSAVVGSLAYELSRPSPPVYQPPVYQYQQFPYGYHQETLYDQFCNCYKIVLVPN